MTERFDVVVPCYRYGHLLEQCVDSVLTQSRVDVRVLVIDDASPDATAEIGRGLADRDQRVIFHRHPSNKGHIATFNEGIDWAEGDNFLLLSADDYLLPGALGRASAMMQQEPDIGFIFGKALILHPDSSFETVHPLGDSLALPARQVIQGRDFIAMGAVNIVPTPTAIVRTALQKRVGGYRVDFPHSGDMEMWLRLASHAPVGFINDAQAVYRRHGANMSLAYDAQYMLPDLRERKRTLSHFFSNEGSSLSGSELQRDLFHALAEQAVAQASRAFNDGNLDAMHQILDFALECAPTVRWSRPWIRLACKQIIGPRAWRALSKSRLGKAA